MEIYDNKKQEMLANGYDAAKAMEERIKSGKVIKDVTDNDGERTIVTETSLGTYGYQVFERGASEPHYYAEGYYLIDDLKKYTDSNGMALRYVSAKSRVQRNLVGYFFEYIKDDGFHSLYASYKADKNSNLNVSQRMSGYNSQDPVVLLGFQFDRKDVCVVSDAQVTNTGDKTNIRIGVAGVMEDGTLDYEEVMKTARSAEMAKRFLGESSMSEGKLSGVMTDSMLNAQSLLYDVYNNLGLPMSPNVTPNNLLADGIKPMLLGENQERKM